MPAQCATVREEFSALLDDELAPGPRAEVESHLSGCSDCLRALDGMKRVNDLYTALPRIGAPDELEARVRRAVGPRLLRFPGGRTGGLAFLALAAGLALVAGTYTLVRGGASPPPVQMAKQAEMRSVAAAASPKATVANETEAAGSADATAATPAPALEEAAPKAFVAAPRMAMKAEPERADTNVHWQAAGRVFSLQDGIWVEEIVDATQLERNITDIAIDSREFQQLTGKFPELLELTAAVIPVEFRAGDEKWYRLLPKKN